MKQILTLLIIIIPLLADSQNKVIAVIGSSTAAGVGASVPDSSWVRRLSNYYKNRGILDTIYNHAVGGYNPYHGMPSGYIPPPGKPSPDVQNNITKAISHNPDVVIISFVSNNYDVYSFEEIRMTLFTLFDSATKAGKVAFVTTTQPRTGFSVEGRLRLRMLKDSIIKWFGSNSINFWNPIADSTDNTIAAAYRSSDDIHLNDAGHRILNEQVVAKNIFSFAVFPIILERFTAAAVKGSVRLNWYINADNYSEVTVQRSNNGNRFESIKKMEIQKGKHDYRFEDNFALTGLNYYRLEINDNNILQYSRVISVHVKKAKPAVANFYPVPAIDLIHLQLKGTEKIQANFLLLDENGRQLQSFNRMLENDQTTITISVNHLSRGNYFLRLEYPGIDPIICPFLKF